ncbi:MAG: HAD-IC family P-type ATPase [Pirellulales bacterium]
MEKLKVEYRLLFGSDVVAKDVCIERLLSMLQTKSGIESAHLVVTATGVADSVCIHFDPSIVSTAEVRDAALRSGATLDANYGHLLRHVSVMHASRASSIQARLCRLDGVLEAMVSPDCTIRVEFDKKITDDESIIQSFSSWTTNTESSESRTELPRVDTHEREEHRENRGHEHTHGGLFGERTELIFAALCGVLLVVGWLLETFGNLFPWLPTACYVASYFFGGYYTLWEAIEKLRSRTFEIDFLMIVAAAGAAALGAWAEGALLLFLFSIGHALEGYAMGKAKRAIEALSEVAPRTARIRRNGIEQEISVDDLVVGDVVVIKPDERVAADGFVIAGESSINQAPITGESVPVDKRPVNDIEAAASAPESLPPEHRAFAGTINQSGSLEVQVTKIASENTMARVLVMVSEAETRVSPTQKFTKKFERYFVPSVIAGVVLLLFAPLIIKETFSESFYRAESFVRTYGSVLVWSSSSYPPRSSDSTLGPPLHCMKAVLW